MPGLVIWAQKVAPQLFKPGSTLGEPAPPTSLKEPFCGDIFPSSPSSPRELTHGLYRFSNLFHDHVERLPLPKPSMGLLCIQRLPLLSDRHESKEYFLELPFQYPATARMSEHCQWYKGKRSKQFINHPIARALASPSDILLPAKISKDSVLKDGIWSLTFLSDKEFYCHRASHSIFCKSVTPLQARIENKTSFHNLLLA